MGCYYPVNSEVDTKNNDIFEKLKITISLPIIEDNFSMEFTNIKLQIPLNINKYGIPEPFKKDKAKYLDCALSCFWSEIKSIGLWRWFLRQIFKKTEKILKLN